jgi:hypothetical protein
MTISQRKADRTLRKAADRLLRKVPISQFWEAQRILILQLLTLGIDVPDIATRLAMDVGVVFRVLDADNMRM